MERTRSIANRKEIVHRLLYSEIRNEAHLLSRKRHYLSALFSACFRLLFVYRSSPRIPGRESILYFVNNAKVSSDLLAKKYNLLRRAGPGDFLSQRYLVSGEVMLILAFLLRSSLLRGWFVDGARRMIGRYLKREKVRTFVCGHPDILTACIGYILRESQGEVITFQHGIYQLCNYQALWFEKEVATKVLVWGNLFRQLYESQGVPSRNLVVGAPFFTRVGATNGEPNGLPVFIGQPFHKSNMSSLSEYNRVIQSLTSFYREMGVILHYKPHPRENIELNLEGSVKRHLIIVEENKSSTLARYGVFYSVSSTLLVEAFVSRRKAFQVRLANADYKCDDFSLYSGIRSISIEDIQSHLVSSDQCFDITSDYLNIRDDYREYNYHVLFETNGV